MEEWIRKRKNMIGSGESQRFNLTSKRFILFAQLGKLPCHKKLAIFKFMFSLSDTFFIMHVLDSNFVFCGPKLDLRQYNIAI